MPAADPTGTVAGFADATGRFLPLVCTLNAARVLDAAAALLGVDHDRLAELALAAPAGADGLVAGALPRGRADAEPARRDRCAARPDARARRHRAHLARAAVEGMLCGLADGLDALGRPGVAGATG